jgi:hypothetical protein
VVVSLGSYSVRMPSLLGVGLIFHGSLEFLPS